MKNHDDNIFALKALCLFRVTILKYLKGLKYLQIKHSLSKRRVLDLVCLFRVIIWKYLFKGSNYLQIKHSLSNRRILDWVCYTIIFIKSLYTALIVLSNFAQFVPWSRLGLLWVGARQIGLSWVIQIKENCYCKETAVYFFQGIIPKKL